MKNCKIKAEGCHGEFRPFNSLQVCCLNVACILKFKNTAQAKKNIKRAEREDYTSKKIIAHSRKYKGDLQKEVNRLSKMIDSRFGYDTCIDCGKPFGKQTDAAHFTSIGANSTTRYNLHNLHSAKSDCNQYSDTHKEGYVKGLEKRYSKEYLDYVQSLPTLYKEIHLTEQEVFEKLKLVRKLIRDFDTMKFEDSLQARAQMNTIIGIYKNK